ncbi:MAG: hypothetical protein ACHREM_14470 [Polyangiales bacterium]
MDETEFTGYGATVEDAIDAATKAALATWKPAGPDDQVAVRLRSLDMLYGGIVGHTGTRVARVALAGRIGLNAVAGVAELSLKLEVFPDVITVNLMPPVRHPQPHKVGLVLSVSNTGDVDYQGQSMTTELVHFSILKGRTTIWESPKRVGDKVTPVTLRPRESRAFSATWDVDDAVPLFGSDLHAVARFVPTGASAVTAIAVRAAF